MQAVLSWNSHLGISALLPQNPALQYPACNTVGLEGTPVSLSLCLIFGKSPGPMLSPCRMLCLSPGPHRGSQPRAQSLALFPGPFLDASEFQSKTNVGGHMTRILGMGRASPVQNLPGSWQGDKARSHRGVSQRREIPSCCCSLLPQVVIIPIERSPVLISVDVKLQNVKYAPKYLGFSLSPCFESHVHLPLCCHPEVSSRGRSAEILLMRDKALLLMPRRETVLRAQMWQHLVKHNTELEVLLLHFFPRNRHQCQQNHTSVKLLGFTTFAEEAAVYYMQLQTTTL